MAKLNGLNVHDACKEGADYFNQFSTPQEFVANCDRGDWILWLFARTNPEDQRELTLAKAHCANTVRHLIKSELSKKAIDVAIAFGNGLASEAELNAAYDAADADDFSAFAAAFAAADDDTRNANRKLTADICRKYLSIEIWNF